MARTGAISAGATRRRSWSAGRGSAVRGQGRARLVAAMARSAHAVNAAPEPSLPVGAPTGVGAGRYRPHRNGRIQNTPSDVLPRQVRLVADEPHDLCKRTKERLFRRDEDRRGRLGCGEFRGSGTSSSAAVPAIWSSTSARWIAWVVRPGSLVAPLCDLFIYHNLKRSSRIRVMPRRTTSRTHDRAPASGYWDYDSRALVG